jgi:hypothetical protein
MEPLSPSLLPLYRPDCVFECHLAVWLPQTRQLHVGSNKNEASSLGTWLETKTDGSATASLRILEKSSTVQLQSPQGRFLLSLPICTKNFAFALVAPKVLILSAYTRGKTFVGACIFGSDSDAVGCAAKLKQVLFPLTSQINPVMDAENILLEAAKSNPYQIGCRLWTDFPWLVNQYENRLEEP